MKITINLALGAYFFTSILGQTTKQCVAQCGISNLGCLTKCMGLPNPSDDQANATNDCNTKCTDSGDGSDACFSNCIKSIFSNNDLNSASLNTNKPTTITDSASKTQDQSSKQTDNHSSKDSTKDSTKDKTSDKSSNTKTSDDSSSTDKASSKDSNTSKPNANASGSATLKSYVTKSTNGIANVDSNANTITLSCGAALSLVLIPYLF